MPPQVYEIVTVGQDKMRKNQDLWYFSDADPRCTSGIIIASRKPRQRMVTNYFNQNK